jgi:uridine kinase
MFGYMLPSTGFIKEYKLLLYAPGFIVQYPRSELDGNIPEFQDEKIFRDALREAVQWGNITNASYIHQMNALVEDGKSLEFINLCETRHNNQLRQSARRTYFRDTHNRRNYCGSALQRHPFAQRQFHKTCF